MSFFAVVLLVGLSTSLFLMSVQEKTSADYQRSTVLALATAEAGIERAIYDLRRDCVDDADWSDGDINGMTIGPDTSNYYSVSGYAGNSLNGGSYAVELKNVSEEDNHIWIKSVGTVDNVSQTIEVYVTATSVDLWNHALFSGDNAIDTEVRAHGSVLTLGTSLTSSDLAIDWVSTSLIRNNYSGMPTSLDTLVGALPQVTHNSETVDTLNANLRVKTGKVALSGSATVGEADSFGDGDKETLDGVFVTNGYGGTNGSSSVYSDNGYSTAYDLGSKISFPSLASSYSGYGSHSAYLLDNSLVVSSAPDLATVSAITTASSFSFSDSNGTLSADGAGNISVSGIVYVDGGGITFQSVSGTNTFRYSGSGVIYSTNDITIGANFLTDGSNSFPSNMVGFMTPGAINFNRSGTLLAGLFYAENTIDVAKQVEVLGTLASNQLTFNGSPPSVYAVPEAKNNLPTGMITASAECVMNIRYWNKQ